MKLAFIDCSFAGASGDMLTAALIDAGADAERVKEMMSVVAEPFGGVEVEVKEVRVDEIKATRVDVKTSDVGGRSYRAIVNQIELAPLPDVVKARALDALENLARAEAKVHGKRLGQLVLHRVGAADAIADIVGCCAAAHDLGLFGGEVIAGEVAVGRGAIEFEHGELPLPAPATLEILRGKPIRGRPIDAELTTPTGAALLVALAKKFALTFPSMQVERVGYGAGARKLEVPNLLRVCLGEASGGLRIEDVAMLETNVDDVPGEVIGFTIEKLLAEGALDVSVVPMLMKKGRPGSLIRVLAKPADAERLARSLMLHTGTLGVRAIPISHRYALERRVVPVDVKLRGERFRARVKVALDGETPIALAAEYEDARSIAERAGLGIREAMARIEAEARRRLKQSIRAKVE